MSACANFFYLISILMASNSQLLLQSPHWPHLWGCTTIGASSSHSRTPRLQAWMHFLQPVQRLRSILIPIFIYYHWFFSSKIHTVYLNHTLRIVFRSGLLFFFRTFCLIIIRLIFIRQDPDDSVYRYPQIHIIHSDLKWLASDWGNEWSFNQEVYARLSYGDDLSYSHTAAFELDAVADLWPHLHLGSPLRTRQSPR